jgi:hypothetical protein
MTESDMDLSETDIDGSDEGKVASTLVWATGRQPDLTLIVNDFAERLAR